MLLVFSGKNCPACAMLKRFLDDKGIAYSEVKVEEHEQYLQTCNKLKFFPTSIPALVHVENGKVNGVYFGFSATGVMQFLRERRILWT